MSWAAPSPTPRATAWPTPRARLGDALVAPLLAVRQRLIAMSLPLDLVAEAVFLGPGCVDDLPDAGDEAFLEQLR